MHKLLCKPIDQATTKDKKITTYETDCCNIEAVYFGESKRFLKLRLDEDKRFFRNKNCQKNQIAKQCYEADPNFSWDQKQVFDGEIRLIPRKIKKTINSLKNPNHINKIFYMLPKALLPNLRSFLIHMRRF